MIARAFSVALQREESYLAAHPQAVDIGSNAPTLRLSETWQNEPAQPEPSEARTSKKSKGLKKIWKIVTGTSSKSVAHVNPTTERQIDDGPLAPPPPLSYLVNGSRARHISTPSLPSTNGSPSAFMHYGSPPTAPSSIIPSPTSSRPSGVDKDAIRDALSRKPSGDVGLDQDDRTPCGDYALPESDSRTRSSSRTLSSVNGPMTPATSPSQRPMSSLLSREKSLPPLPGESYVEFPNHAIPDGRPQTVFTYDPNSLSSGGLAPPQAAFRNPETRRQSFGGVGSRPLHNSQILSTVGTRPQTGMPFVQEKFNEFGASTMSIGQWVPGQYSQPMLSIPSADKPKKRKSKFGLASLFGRKSVHGHINDGLVVAESLEFPAFRTSQSHSDSPYDGYTTNGNGGAVPSGYAASTVSMYGNTNASAPRLSVMSRRNLDLVEQDPEFVAYRYPSTDQRLDLVR